MQSHEDSSHNLRNAFLNELRGRAKELYSENKSTIAAGGPNEIPMAKWRHKSMHVAHLPDDPQKIARISIGGGEGLPVDLNYCSIRGTVGQCIDLLEKAIAALKACPE